MFAAAYLFWIDHDHRDDKPDPDQHITDDYNAAGTCDQPNR